jgi:hypothetical protein
MEAPGTTLEIHPCVDHAEYPHRAFPQWVSPLALLLSIHLSRFGMILVMTLFKGIAHWTLMIFIFQN